MAFAYGQPATDRPISFCRCSSPIVFASSAAPVRLIRANLMQTLISFDRTLDARLEFRFGLFADNTCRLRDGLDNKALALQ